METNEIISKIENATLQTEEDLQNIAILLSGKDETLIKPLFNLLERFPDFHFGKPGPIIHYLAQFPDDVYTPCLYASVCKKPTEYNIWMMNRLLNS